MRPPSGDTRKRSKQTVEERKEIIKNIQGIEVQIKNLVDKVVNEDKIKLIGTNIQETLNLNSTAVKLQAQKAFSELSEMFRHLLRMMVKLDHDNEIVATMLNLIWKVATYFIDITIDVNTKEIEKCINDIKDEYDKKKEGLNDIIHEFVKRNETHDQKIKLNLQRLKEENERIDIIARDREQQLQMLANPDEIKKYKNMLNDFSQYLAKNQQEKQKQLMAMGEMLTMMKDCKLEVPGQKSRSTIKANVSAAKLEKFYRAQKTGSRSYIAESEAEYHESHSTISPINKSFRKLASAEVPTEFYANLKNTEDVDEELNEEMKLTENRLNEIARKSMYHKPDMASEEDEEDKNAVTKDDINKALRGAEISKFRQNLEKKRKEQEHFERNKLLTKSMSILERRQKQDMNRQVISFALEMQILEVLRAIKGKAKSKENVETQTDEFKFLPNNVHDNIDYDNLDEKKELYAISKIVLPQIRKNDSDAEEEVSSKKKRKKKKRPTKRINSGSTFKIISGSTLRVPVDGKDPSSVSSFKILNEIEDEYGEFEEEEEESESEFEKSEGEHVVEDIHIKLTDDKETKRRKLREAYFRLARQASTMRSFEVNDLNPSNAGPSKDNPLIEVMEVDLNLKEKALPMPEGTLFKTIESTLDVRYIKEIECISGGDTDIKMELSRFFYDQLLMNYGLK